MRFLYVPALSIPLLLVGCVAGGSIASLPITLSLPTTPQIVDGGGTLTFQVNIDNDFGADGAKWTLKGPGTLTYPATATAAKYVTFYNAPTDVAATTSATVTATSVADTTKTASATITVYPTVVLAALPLGLATKSGVAFSYTLPGSGGSGPLTYAVTS
jgi:hypothetical protein